MDQINWLFQKNWVWKARRLNSTSIFGSFGVERLKFKEENWQLFSFRTCHASQTSDWFLEGENSTCSHGKTEKFKYWDECIILAFYGDFGLSDFQCRDRSQFFFNWTPFQILKDTKGTLIKQIGPVDREKWEFGNREKSAPRAFFLVSGKKNPIEEQS